MTNYDPNNGSRAQCQNQDTARGSEAAVQTADTSPDQRRETPLPWGKLSSLLAVRLSEPVNFTLILPFVYQMVRDFGVAKSPKDIAFYAGLLFTSFSVCQTLMVMHWGRLSDRIGRKPVIMIGLVGNLISSILLGTSKTFKAAIIARSFNGLMAGNVVVVKTMVAEISDSTNRSRMMAMIPLMFNLGSVAGSAIGGLFADPVNQYPKWFGNSVILKEYPYLLPFLIGSAVTTFGLIVGLFRLEETLVTKRKDLETPASPASTAFSTPSPLPNESATATTSLSSSSVTLNPENAPLLNNRPQQLGIRQLLTPTVVRVMTTNVFVCISFSMGDQIYPIFAATNTSDGGLGLSTREIGISLAVASVVVIYLQLMTYPRLERKYGVLKCYQRGQKTIIPFYLLLPFLNLVAKQVDVSRITQNFPSISHIVLWIMLICLLLVRVVGVVLVMTSINLLTANLAPSRAELGFMNGTQQLAMSTTRIVGPLISGTIWSWSIKHSLPFPFDFHLLWNICALLVFISFKLSGRIPQSVNVFGADRQEIPNTNSAEQRED